jgi:hypothetical protein
MKILADCEGSNKSDETLKPARPQAKACEASIEVAFAMTLNCEPARF